MRTRRARVWTAMKHKTSELTGRLLDEAVFRADGLAATRSTIIKMTDFGSGRGGALVSNNVPAYSSDMAHGGPIIERERISIFADHGTDWLAAMPEHRLGEWGTWTHSTTGTTALETAMRAFVFAKMGAEVDL